MILGFARYLAAGTILMLTDNKSRGSFLSKGMRKLDLLLGVGLGLILIVPIIRSSFGAPHSLWLACAVFTVTIYLFSLVKYPRLPHTLLLPSAVFAIFAFLLVFSSVISQQLSNSDGINLLILFVLYVISSSLRSSNSIITALFILIAPSVCISLLLIFNEFLGVSFSFYSPREGYLTSRVIQAMCVATLTGAYAGFYLSNKSDVKIKVALLAMLALNLVGLSLNYGRGALLFGMLSSFFIFAFSTLVYFKKRGAPSVSIVVASIFQHETY